MARPKKNTRAPKAIAFTKCTKFPEKVSTRLPKMTWDSFCIHYLMICREAKYNYSVDCNLSKRRFSSMRRLKNASFVRIILMLLFLPFKATEWVEAAAIVEENQSLWTKMKKKLQ